MSFLHWDSSCLLTCSSHGDSFRPLPLSHQGSSGAAASAPWDSSLSLLALTWDNSSSLLSSHGDMWECPSYPHAQRSWYLSASLWESSWASSHWDSLGHSNLSAGTAHGIFHHNSCCPLTCISHCDISWLVTHYSPSHTSWYISLRTLPTATAPGL